MSLNITRRQSWTALRLARHKLKLCHSSQSILEIKALINKNTEVSRNHLTPEIALHLITPACPLWKAQMDNCPFNDPFWGFYWPGGQAVTRFILDNPVLVRGKSVIDVGSGCGASAIVASKCGAKLALSNDIDPVAGIAAEMNAELNNEVIKISSKNHIADGVKDLTKIQYLWDVVIIGDLFYDAEIAQRVMTWVKNCSSQGALVLIGDPGRYAFNEVKGSGKQDEPNLPALSMIKQYLLLEDSCLENNGFSHASVWRLNG